MIKKFIKIAKALMGNNDLNATHAILNALNIEAIERLEKTWKVSVKNQFNYFIIIVFLFSDNKQKKNYFEVSQKL